MLQSSCFILAMNSIFVGKLLCVTLTSWLVSFGQIIICGFLVHKTQNTASPKIVPLKDDVKGAEQPGAPKIEKKSINLRPHLRPNVDQIQIHSEQDEESEIHVDHIQEDVEAPTTPPPGSVAIEMQPSKVLDGKAAVEGIETTKRLPPPYPLHLEIERAQQRKSTANDMSTIEKSNDV